MEFSEIEYLHFITNIDNIPSILEKVILSHNRIRAQRIRPQQIDDPKVQEIRDNITLPNGTHLHDHANLYFNPRNAMMYKRKSWHKDLCVLRVAPKIMNTTGVMVTDMNASSDWRNFYSTKELWKLDSSLIFLRDWNHDHYPTYLRRKSSVCAEVLVPNCVPPSLIS